MLELAFGHGYGSTGFWVLSGVAAGGLLVFGWTLISLVLRAKSGLILTFIGLLLPLLAGLVAISAIEIHANPHIANETVRASLPWIALGVTAFLVALTLSRAVFGFREGKALFSILLVYALTAGAVYLVGGMFEQTEEGLRELEDFGEGREEFLNFFD